MKLAKVALIALIALVSLPAPCLAAAGVAGDAGDAYDSGNAGDAFEGFRYSAGVVAEKGPSYAAVRLTPEIVGKSKSDLSDLLLVSEGQAVPYFINSHSIAESPPAELYEMDLSDSYMKDSFQYLDYRLAPALELKPGTDIAATSINMEASGQFVKDIELYGSYDGMHWDFVGSDSIFQVDGSSRLSIPLRPAGKHTWYRFRVSGNQEPVSFGRVWLERSLDAASRYSFVETLAPAVTVRQDGKSTVVALDGLKNLALSEIELKTDSMFKRDVSVNGRSYALYNLVFGSGRYRDLTVPMDGWQCLPDRLELRISDGDDAPVKVDSVLVSYLASDVVFQNTGLPVTLYFGNGAISAPPRYDIASYKEHVLAEGYGKAGIGEISERPAKLSKESGAPDYTALFNATIIAAAVLLAALLIMRLKNVKKEKDGSDS